MKNRTEENEWTAAIARFARPTFECSLPMLIFMHISCTFETKLGTFRVRHSFVKPGPTAVNLRGALTLTVLVEAIVGRFGQRQLYVRCIKPLKGKTPNTN